MSEMSRRNTDFIKDIVLSNKALFEDLFKLILLNEEPISRRAIWVVDVISEIEPDMLKSYLDDLIAALKEFSHDGLKRHTLRILARYDLSLDQFMPILDICLHYLGSEKESVAVRYQAMHLLYKMSNKEHGLKYELVTVIELQMHGGSTGLQNQSVKILKTLKKKSTNSKENKQSIQILVF